MTPSFSDALQDFIQPKPPKPTQAPTVPSAPFGTDLASLVTAAGITAAVGGQEGQPKPGDMWTEEFVQQATSQFEQTMRLLMQQQQQQLEGKSDLKIAYFNLLYKL